MLENKTKLITDRNIWEYIELILSFAEFSKIYLKFKDESNSDFIKNLFIKNNN